MHRRMIAPLLMALVAPMVAQASVISMQGSGILLPETAGQQVILQITGTDFYTESLLKVTINGGVGPAPAISHVFGDFGGSIPTASLAGSVWANGAGGIGLDPYGTSIDSTGRQTLVHFGTQGFASINSAGIYALLTVSTVGVPAGAYSVTLEDAELFNGLDSEFENILVPLELPSIIWLVVPEPSTYALAAFGIVALLSARRRKSTKCG